MTFVALFPQFLSVNVTTFTRIISQTPTLKCLSSHDLWQYSELTDTVSRYTSALAISAKNMRKTNICSLNEVIPLCIDIIIFN